MSDSALRNTRQIRRLFDFFCEALDGGSNRQQLEYYTTHMCRYLDLPPDRLEDVYQALHRLYWRVWVFKDDSS